METRHGKMRRNADNWSHVSATLVPDSPSKVPSMGYVPKGEYLLPLALFGSYDTVKTNRKEISRSLFMSIFSFSLYFKTVR
ncbi:hypothetical protein E2C01_054499 [Portunus trituberculatus]|uniref:Uncharacterized protein n=1 Tax=Portunus trituberculatus TaxID=210409 RepID=A0A5B7GV70_PORTR|nr:hypothetical protein [Portunus trituberculatus]